MIISWNKQHELFLNTDADERMMRGGGKEDNDYYTPRLRRIDGESLILWMDSGKNEGWLRQNRSEQWLKNGEKEGNENRHLDSKPLPRLMSRPRLMSFSVHLATLKVVDSPEEFAY